MKTRHWDRIGNGGLTFTELGFGTAPLGNLYRAVSDEDAQATLEAAWDSGFRYYDTAPLYGLGLSETRLNQFLRGKKRDEYVLSTKVGRGDLEQAPGLGGQHILVALLAAQELVEAGFRQAEAIERRGVPAVRDHGAEARGHARRVA